MEQTDRSQRGGGWGRLEEINQRIQIIFQRASCPASVEKNILSMRREMINGSQSADFLRDCDLAPETWGAGRSDSPGCDLNRKEGAAIECLLICWLAGCPGLSALSGKVQISFSPTTPRPGASFYMQEP